VKTRRKYGVEWPIDEWSDVMIELACFNVDHKPEKGGLGAAGHLENAMKMLWPHLYAGEVAPGIPRWRPEIDMMVKAWCNYKFIAVIGHASAAKTHTFAHIGVASYLADAYNTILTLTSTHLPGLRKRLWADVVSAVSNNACGFSLHIRNHDMTMRPKENPLETKYVIEGIAVDRGQEAVERIQGNHSRRNRYFIIDEAQGTPQAVFQAFSNLLTDPNFKAAFLANPTKKHSEFGSWCEPVDGWDSIDPDEHVMWETKRGGVCVRLDGLRSPNVAAGEIHFPFLISQEYVDDVIRSYGKDSPRYWTFVRGWFPPDGLLGHVFSLSLLNRCRDQIQFPFPPTKFAAFDPAFEGGDDRVIAIAEYGDLPDGRVAFNLLDTRSVGISVGSTNDPMDYQIARKVRQICEAEGIEPRNLIVDTTGSGRSIHAILAKEWSRDVQRCNFGAAATDRPLKHGEQDLCSDLFDRFATELWFATKAWAEEGLIGGIVDPELIGQLTGREYETVGDRKMSLERKHDYKKRVGSSPDKADTLTLLVELLRRRGHRAGEKTTKTRAEHPLKARARKTNLVEAWLR